MHIPTYACVDRISIWAKSGFVLARRFKKLSNKSFLPHLTPQYVIKLLLLHLELPCRILASWPQVTMAILHNSPYTDQWFSLTSVYMQNAFYTEKDSRYYLVIGSSRTCNLNWRTKRHSCSSGHAIRKSVLSVLWLVCVFTCSVNLRGSNSMISL